VRVDADQGDLLGALAKHLLGLLYYELADHCFELLVVSQLYHHIIITAIMIMYNSYRIDIKSKISVTGLGN